MMYIAQTPIKHGGKRYKVGEQVDLTKSEADPLLDAGAVVLDRKAATEKAAAEKPGGKG